MPRLVGLACTAMLAFLVAQPESDRFWNYKRLEAYEIRPGILMLPTYSDDGQVCEIGLQRLHYQAGKIDLRFSLSHEEIDAILDEVAPPNERGPKSKDVREYLAVETGHAVTTNIPYENVLIQTFGWRVDAKGNREILVDDAVATISWKNRKCRQP